MGVWGVNVWLGGSVVGCEVGVLRVFFCVGALISGRVTKRDLFDSLWLCQVICCDVEVCSVE